MDRKPGDWIAVLGISASGRSESKPSSKRCEAWFFSGFHHLMMGDQEKALRYFERSVATEETSRLALALSNAELELKEEVEE